MLSDYIRKSEWIETQNAAIDIVNLCYNKQFLGPELIDKILKLKGDLAPHRAHNFIGSMLQYRSMASTKYMSKWIEAKNENLNSIDKVNK
jgi:hypothetical protein